VSQEDLVMGFIDGSDPFLSWGMALASVLVVTVAVHLMLRLIVGSARDVERALDVIWAHGQRIANNTIHIANLYRTRDLVHRILGGVNRIAVHAKAIEAHAKACPGCPECLLSRRR
jgi:hypothetical protein